MKILPILNLKANLKKRFVILDTLIIWGFTTVEFNDTEISISTINSENGENMDKQEIEELIGCLNVQIEHDVQSNIIHIFC